LPPRTAASSRVEPRPNGLRVHSQAPPWRSRTPKSLRQATRNPLGRSSGWAPVPHGSGR
jgi:hypothetical protein